ncbi:MAG TPA: metalloregulator ArsR/SmtB family transcription factor [Gaiellaceae bacterium]|jgi:ArsR family transcriptional regulator, arsenate/arsenite/antimonite-responsive transcriptional repressor
MNELLAKVCCRPGTTPSDAHAFAGHAQCFKALSEPARVAIVNRLASGGEACVCELVDVLGLAQPTVSHHLRVLREAGLIEHERRGTWMYYRLVPAAIEELRATLTP